MMKRTFVIGDTHGCFTELLTLIGLAGLAHDDEIIALGDFVDRGPQTPQVLDFFRRTPHTRAIMGNHERKHVGAFDGRLKPALSQIIARRQIGEEHYPEAIVFFRQLPLFLDLPEALLVHGFFEPGIPLEHQRDTVLAGTLSGEFYLRKHYPVPWYELYDGTKPLVVAHHDYLRTGEPLIVRDRVYGIDTGCVHGGRLTGLLLPEFRVISVPARADHWTAIQQAHVAAMIQDVRRVMPTEPGVDRTALCNGERIDGVSGA